MTGGAARPPQPPTPAAFFARAALCGVVAGLVSSIPGAVEVVVTGKAPWYDVRLIATIVGFEPGGTFEAAPVAVAALLHLGLSALFALPLVALVDWVPVRRARGLVVGAVWGLLLFVVNFHVLARLAGLEALARRGTSAWELAAHLLYGIGVVAVWELSRRRAAGAPIG